MIIKRLTALALSGALMLTGLTFMPCRVSAEDVIPSGGWEKVESPEITPELKALTDKAFSSLVGMEYIPVAYLEKQVVAGTNHKILCREKSITPDATEVYSIVTINEDLNDGVQVTDIVSSSVATNISDQSGGWVQAESPVVTPELSAMFAKPYEGLAGAYHTPIALLSTQVVSGTNYCFLAETGPVIPNPEMKLVFTTIYQDLEGNVSVVEEIPFSETDPVQQPYETVKKGKKIQLDAGAKVSKVTVSEKNIAKAKKSGKKVIVTGKKPGTTTVTAYDKKGEIIASWVVTVE